MNPLRAAIDQIPNKIPWEQQFIIYFQNSFDLLKQYDDLHILALDPVKLKRNFIQNYDNLYKDIIAKVGMPDRHKVIAMLTKAFLDAAPFYHARDVSELLALDNKDMPIRQLIYPNEALALDICKVILTEHNKAFKNLSTFEFSFPNNVYINTPRIASTDYEYELFLLYRHYVNTKAKGFGKFSIYQMAHTYFLLEMGYDIAKYEAVDKYYS